MAQSTTAVPYGYTFVALDPDDNRLRKVKSIYYEKISQRKSSATDTKNNDNG